MQRIGLIAAMQEEIKPLLSVMGPAELESAGRHRMYRFQGDMRSVCLVESGIGPANAASAANMLIETCQPELIINFGLAGSLSPELSVTDIVIADRLLMLHDGHLREQTGLNEELAGNVLQDAVRAAFITTEKMTAKKELAARLPDDIFRAVVEMETAFVANAAQIAGIPFIAVRAISDGFDEELGFSLDEFCDRKMKLQKWRVMLTMAKKPWILPQLIRLSGNSQSASRALAKTVMDILSKLK